VQQLEMPVLLLINKIDQTDQTALEKMVAQWSTLLPKAEIYPISALNNFAIDRVQKRILELLPESPPYFEKDALTDKPARFFVAEIIREIAGAWSLGWASAQEIDSLGISAAVRIAAERALDALPLLPHHLLTDFRLSPDTDIPLTSIVKGDRKSLSIAAASVLAKTARDARMCELDAQYPGYDLLKHKGYGTLSHRRAITTLGYSPIHRRTFALKASPESTQAAIP
jgi:ribonuclease HII